ncbi:MAG: LamG-like jellyroll fold domain-containing protein [Verrucomicrobiales bacterium]
MKKPPILSIPILMGLLAWTSPQVKSQDIFGWWPLNEGTGDTANDISGNDLSALINNVDFGGLGDGESAWAEDPEFGTVLSFNGIDNSGAYAVVGNPPDSGTLPIFTTEADSEFTWSFWAKSEQGANNDVILGNRYSSAGGDFAPRQFIKFTTRMFEWDTNNVQGLDYEDIPAGIWMHHVVVKSGTELTYYRDGFQSGSRTIVAAPQDPQPVYFGGQGVENWAGYMSDVRLYNAALSEAEIQTVYENRGVFSTEDDDEDGLPDIWEEKYAGNLTDLSGVATVLEDEISFGGPITDEASMGVSTDITYTHAMSGHTAVTINGVTFEALRPNQYPENFDYENFRHEAGNGAWVQGNPMSQALRAFWNPTTGGVTSSEIRKMMDAFFANGAGGDGSNEDIRLSGLTPGQAYEFRFYHRPLGPAGSLPPNFGESYADCIMKFTTGGNSKSISYDIAEASKPPINMANNHQVFYLSYKYTAGDDGKLVLNVKTPKVVPNWWEDQSSSSPLIFALSNQEIEGGGNGDFDSDGLTDLDEYEETRTDPTKADTDEDGLGDAVETNTGTYVSATNTGTNPRKADSDNDGLLDGVETKTGLFIAAENTGTDPNNADTDGDGFSDGGEVIEGTDPLDPNSKGGIPAPILYLDFEDGAIDLSGNTNDGEVNGDVTFDAEGAEGGPTPTTGASFNGGHLNIPGVDMSGIIQDIEGENSYTLSAWIKPSDLGGNKFLWGQTSQGIHNGIRNGGFLHQAHWGADTNGATNLSTLEGQWIHAAWVYDGDADVGTIYLNGEVDWTGGKRAPNGSGNLLVGGSNGGGDNYRGLVDDVAVWNEVLPEGSIKALADGTSPIGASQEDDDGDGLPDAWEEKYGVDDPEGDDDNDGLTNIEEYEARTKPNKADSDEDGLSDKAEIEEHETNPLNPDADKDGLLDGEEIAAGTDPENKDTDGDGITDFNEIQNGTDPLVVTAIAFETNLVSYWPLDSDFDDAKAENHGLEEGGPIEFQTGKFDGAVYLNGSQSIEITGDENTFDFAGESFTVSAWYTAEAINKSWQCLVAKGEGNGWRLHRRGGDNPPEMTFTGGNGDVDRHNVAMTVGGDPETWHHVAGVTDADTQEQILYLDGEEVARKAGATLQDRSNPMRIGDNPDARNRNWQGKVDDVAVWGRALQPNEIAEIWDGGSGKSIEDMLGLSVPFDFTSVIYDANDDSFRFEWNSKPNRTYALYFSETLEEFGADVDDSIESGGESTVYPPVGEPGLPNPLEGARKIFFKIEENQ